jgi:hypothetical protein
VFRMLLQDANEPEHRHRNSVHASGYINISKCAEIIALSLESMLYM